ncbi:putative pentatricopeptide repeat-containing protein [Acorus gramineus]|uniref:Pentatricopeptide repeat-containing protein n=1 Tax=Acorus gramineus TaxID=55184 RepID=A0AAV9AT31_ACOGR|nr:putative pentatricopeptide repeat-containing protein [Acorus gramineus]
MNRRDRVLFLLERCNGLRQLKQLHGHIIISGLARNDVVPLSKLIDRCTTSDEPHLLDYSLSIFARVPRPSPYMWNSIIRGLSLADRPDDALSAYAHMQVCGLSPDHFTFPFALQACARKADLRLGSRVHARVSKTGFNADVYVSTALVHMYSRCADMGSADRVFRTVPNRNVVGWTVLIDGYVDDGRPDEAVKMFVEMEAAGVTPNVVTAVNVLSACAGTRDLETGKRVHRWLTWSSSTTDTVVGTALIDMYGKCGCLDIAHDVFERMPCRNTWSWNALIGGYSLHGRPEKAIELLLEMRAQGMEIDKVTVLEAMGASSRLGSLDLGRAIHAHLEKTSIGGGDVVTGTSLMDMYAKTGDDASARRVFCGLGSRDLVAWTSMITGLAKQGRASDALSSFEEMQDEGISPDRVAYISVMSACSHAGLIEEGRRHFESMRTVHGIDPKVEHYGCMVDLLSRAGRLAEAERLVRSIPVPPDVSVWGALLGGCRIHGDVNVAEWVEERMVEMGPQGRGVYVLLSNVYAGVGRWGRVETVRESVRRRVADGSGGCSSVEVKLLSS